MFLFWVFLWEKWCQKFALASRAWDSEELHTSLGVSFVVVISYDVCVCVCGLGDEVLWAGKRIKSDPTEFHLHPTTLLPLLTCVVQYLSFLSMLAWCFAWTRIMVYCVKVPKSEAAPSTDSLTRFKANILDENVLLFVFPEVPTIVISITETWTICILLWCKNKLNFIY